MFGLFQSSRSSSYHSFSTQSHQPFLAMQSTKRKRSRANSFSAYVRAADNPKQTSPSITFNSPNSPMNLPQYQAMPPASQDECLDSPLDSVNRSKAVENRLAYLAEAALADASTSSTLVSSHRRSSVTLPSISSLIASSPSMATSLLSSGSAHIPISSAESPVWISDQPVFGVNEWSVSGPQVPSISHHDHQGNHLHYRSPKKGKDRMFPPSSSISGVGLLEYDTLSYTRSTPSTSRSEENKSAVSVKSTLHAPIHTQPGRAKRSKAPHPLHGLNLDRTYPERRVEDWHNDAQNLLRPPKPQQVYISPIITKSSTNQSIFATPPHIFPTTRKIHPPAKSWHTYTLPQMPREHLILPQLQPNRASSPTSAQRPQLFSSLGASSSWNQKHTSARQRPHEVAEHSHVPDPSKQNTIVFSAYSPTSRPMNQSCKLEVRSPGEHDQGHYQYASHHNKRKKKNNGASLPIRSIGSIDERHNSANTASSWPGTSFDTGISSTNSDQGDPVPNTTPATSSSKKSPFPDSSLPITGSLSMTDNHEYPSEPDSPVSTGSSSSHELTKVPLSSVSSTSANPSNRTKTEKVARRSGTREGRGKEESSSRTEDTGEKGVQLDSLNRNNPKRREQNAVAQKRFRKKKKQMAVKMAADLDSARELATSLRKEVVEKDKKIKKLEKEAVQLKRKLQARNC
ncbi:uncharacterized protein IL334_003165 [Kwoniella shivajii]|uniref:BZIP domain-containing protein n=1 Tax=Kwoniella shivajii TaxID=564305 RepID=A0ABZ1CXY5_9TREE|nr:hypothetical protein IL334_003165 [Kwoniella shivajii]